MCLDRDGALSGSVPRKRSLDQVRLGNEKIVYAEGTLPADPPVDADLRARRLCLDSQASEERVQPDVPATGTAGWNLYPVLGVCVAWRRDLEDMYLAGSDRVLDRAHPDAPPVQIDDRLPGLHLERDPVGVPRARNEGFERLIAKGGGHPPGGEGCRLP